MAGGCAYGHVVVVRGVGELGGGGGHALDAETKETQLGENLGGGRGWVFLGLGQVFLGV